MEKLEVFKELSEEIALRRGFSLETERLSKLKCVIANLA